MNVTMIIMTILLLIFFSWNLYLIFKLIKYSIEKKKYTREYFAVFGVSVISTSCIVVLSYIFSSQNLIQILNYIGKYCHSIFKLNGSPIQINLASPSISDKIVAIVILLIISYVVLKIFNSFTGPITVRQAAEKINREDPNLFSDFLAYFFNKDRLKIYSSENKEIDFSLSPLFTDTQPWHKQFAELLKISTKQFKIDIENDFYNEFDCFISKYGVNNDIVGILCTLDTPTENQMDNFIEFINSNKKDSPVSKLIVGIKDGLSEKYNKEILGYPVEFRFENEFLNGLVDLDDYINQINKKFEKEEIIVGYPATLNDIFTTPSATIHVRGNTKEETKYSEIPDIVRYVSNWLADRRENKQLAILGEYGQGKSVLAQRICYLIFNKIIITDRIPIFIELRAKFPKQHSDRLSFFSEWAKEYGIDPRGLLKLHNAGKLLILFDGFDEMELIGDYNIRLDHFRKIWEFSSPNAKFIITGRPNFFLNDKELKTLLRTSIEFNNSVSFCEEIHIKSFSNEQIKEALRHCDKSITDDILHSILQQGKNSSFHDLIARPTHLFMASIVWKQKLSKYKNNLNSAFVYKEFLDYCYSRQDLKGIKTPLATFERSYFMKGIAVQIATKSIFSGQISQLEMQETTLKLYDKFPNEITDNSVVKDTNAISLNKRFDERYDKETVFLDVRSCGVIVRDLSTFDMFKFAHKSFFEYLISEYYLSQIINSKYNQSDDSYSIETVIKNSLKNSLAINLNDIKRTKDVFLFMTELLCNRINHWDKYTHQEKAKKLFKMVSTNPRLPIKIALYIRPIMQLKLINVISIAAFILIHFIFFYELIKSNLFGTTMIILLIAILATVYFSRILRRSKILKSMILLSVSGRKYGNFVSDYDNTLLWYSACKKLDIPQKELEFLISKKKIKYLEDRLNSMSTEDFDLDLLELYFARDKKANLKK